MSGCKVRGSAEELPEETRRVRVAPWIVRNVPAPVGTDNCDIAIGGRAFHLPETGYCIGTEIS